MLGLKTENTAKIKYIKKRNNEKGEITEGRMKM
jgi:hypothetical protein